jgi:NADPH:quinone reductase-like Zn-dependent oxidoreductase
MRAVVRSAYGPPDVLRLEDLPVPKPAAGQIRVRVAAASVNMADLDYLYGRPSFVRLVFGLRAPRNPRLGVDVAGTVEAVGEGVTALRLGDEVFGDLTEHGWGSFAEQVVADVRAFAPKPPSMSLVEASTIPQSGSLALLGLSGGRPIQPGDRVLIVGASGNVGPFAVQIAKWRGAEVTGVCSPGKVDLVRALGADHVIDYRAVDVTRTGQRYDRILDVHARHSLFDYRRILTRDGVYGCLGGSGGRAIQALVVGPVITLATQRRMGMPLPWKPFAPADIAELTALIEAGRLRPIIDRTYPLAEAAAALRHVDEGHARGKVVITP